MIILPHQPENVKAQGTTQRDQSVIWFPSLASRFALSSPAREFLICAAVFSVYGMFCPGISSNHFDSVLQWFRCARDRGITRHRQKRYTFGWRYDDGRGIHVGIRFQYTRESGLLQVLLSWVRFNVTRLARRYLEQKGAILPSDSDPTSLLGPDNWLPLAFIRDRGYGWMRSLFQALITKTVREVHAALVGILLNLGCAPPDPGAARVSIQRVERYWLMPTSDPDREAELLVWLFRHYLGDVEIDEYPCTRLRSGKILVPHGSFTVTKDYKAYLKALDYFKPEEMLRLNNSYLKRRLGLSNELGAISDDIGIALFRLLDGIQEGGYSLFTSLLAPTAADNTRTYDEFAARLPKTNKSTQKLARALGDDLHVSARDLSYHIRRQLLGQDGLLEEVAHGEYRVSPQWFPHCLTWLSQMRIANEI